MDKANPEVNREITDEEPTNARLVSRPARSAAKPLRGQAMIRCLFPVSILNVPADVATVSVTA